MSDPSTVRVVRRHGFLALIIAGTCVVLMGAFILLWFKLPAWKPEWVVEHSPFLDPLLSASVYGDDERARERIVAWGPGLVPALVARLDDPRAPVRALLAECLGRAKDACAVDALVAQATGDSDDEAAEAAAEALGTIGDRRAVPALISLAGSGRRKLVAEAAIGALGAIRDARAITPLVALLGNEDISGDEVVDALLKLPHDAVISAVLPFPSGDTSQLWSRFSLVTLLDDPRAVVALAAIMREAPPAGWRPFNLTTRGEVAAGSLAHARHADGVPLLVAAFADPLVHVRVHAVSGVLGTYGRKVDPRLLPPLRAALADPQAMVRSLAAFACGYVRLDGVEPTLYAMLTDPDAEMRAHAATGLGNTWGPDESIPRLAVLLGDSEDRVRVAAVSALRRTAKPAAVEALLAAAPGVEAKLQLRIAEAFASRTFTKDPRTFPWLLRLLAEGSAYRHNQAKAALDRLTLDDAQRRQVDRVEALWVEVKPPPRAGAQQP